MRYGDILKNGATVTEVYSNVYGTWVLAVTQDAWHPYVTWQVGPDGDLYWGNYFDIPENAHKDFQTRTGMKPRFENDAAIRLSADAEAVNFWNEYVKVIKR